MKNMQRKHIALLAITFALAVILTTGAASAIPNPDVSDITKNTTSNYDYVNTPLTITTTVDNVPVLPPIYGDNATGVKVTYIIPTGFTVNSATASKGSYNTATNTWNIGNLNVYEVQTLALSLTPTTALSLASGPQDIQTILTQDLIPTPRYNDFTDFNNPIYIVNATFKITGEISQNQAGVNDIFYKNIILEKSGSDDIPQAGDPLGAEPLTITDMLKPNFFFWSDNVIYNLNPWAGDDGNYNPVSGLWTWTLDSLGTGNNKLINQLRVQLTGNPIGTSITNTAEITQTYQSVTLGPVTPIAANVKVTKTVDKKTTTPGSPVVYTITADNQGPSQATGVSITDFFNYPGDIASIVANVSQGTYAAGVWTIGTLANGAKAVLTLTVTFNNNALSPGLADLEVNTATEFQEQFNKYATNFNNEQIVTEAVWVIPTNLQITKTVSDSTPAVGEPFSFTVNVTNSGPLAVRNVWVADLLPQFNQGLIQLVSASVNKGTLTNIVGFLPVWTIDTLAIGETATLTLNMVSSSASTGFIANNTAIIAAFEDFTGDWWFNGVTGIPALPPTSWPPNLTGFLTANAQATISPAFTLVSTNPADGATGVSLNPTITVNFSQALTAIDPTKIILKLTASPGTHINFNSAFSGNTLTLTPLTTLAAGTKYTVIIGAGAATSAVATLAEPYLFRFSTGTAPVVLRTNPVNNAVGILRQQTLVITYDQAIKKASGWIQIKLTNAPGTFLIPGVDYTVSFTDPNFRNVIVKILSPLAANTKYSVLVHTGAVSGKTSDITSTAPYVFRFTTGSV